ncbi:class I glutamine amidotransferase-like protein [Podospora conica]|nr:class I glutamine amidotransferase-like protein [Schizothecium conicum]
MTASAPRDTVRVGVFIPQTVQLLDLACVDIIGTMSYEYLSVLRLVPAAMYNLAPSVKIHFIGSVQRGELIELTTGIKIACTHHFSDPEVKAGELDVVIVPGPDPDVAFDPAAMAWLAAQGACEGTDILSVCSGIYLCGTAGLLKGRQACGPRMMQSELKAKFEGVTWVGDEYRWMQDGNFWSGGGVTNGNDLVSAYVRHSPKFPAPLAEFGLSVTETGDRSQKYEVGQARFTATALWNIIRAALMGLTRRKQD